MLLWGCLSSLTLKSLTSHASLFALSLVSYSAREEKLFEETLRNRSTSAFYYGTNSGAGTYHNNANSSSSSSSGSSGPASSSSMSSPQSSTTNAGVAGRGALAFPSRVPVDSGWAVASPNNNRAGQSAPRADGSLSNSTSIGDENSNASAQVIAGGDAAAAAAVLGHGEAVGTILRSHPIQGRGLPEVRWFLCSIPCCSSRASESGLLVESTVL